jgi:hypothetical protein
MISNKSTQITLRLNTQRSHEELRAILAAPDSGLNVLPFRNVRTDLEMS